MATWTPQPDGDVAIAGWSKEVGVGTPIFGEVDEGIAAADSQGVRYTGDGNTTVLTLALSAPPGSLGDGGVTGVTINLRHRQSGRSDDLMRWYGRILHSSGLPLAALNSGGTAQQIAPADPYRVAYGANGAVAFTYVRHEATAAQWADARIVLYGTLERSGARDTVTWYIDALDIVVTHAYNVDISASESGLLADSGPVEWTEGHAISAASSGLLADSAVTYTVEYEPVTLTPASTPLVWIVEP